MLRCRAGALLPDIALLLCYMASAADTMLPAALIDAAVTLLLFDVTYR